MVPVTEKRVTFLQNLNTVILTIIGLAISAVLALLININRTNNAYATELVRLRTVQDNNVSDIKDVNQRVTTLEINNMETIKAWVDQNYLRKPQTK